MQTSRKLVKIGHTVASAGLIGGMAAYMILLTVSVPTDAASYAGLRSSIEIVSGWILIPSLAVALVSGLLSMLVHTPFLDKGWVWVKAATGILMFKGVLHIDAGHADHAAKVAQQIAEGTAPAGALDKLVAAEWWTLVTVLAVAVINVALGVWRPRRLWPEGKPAKRVAAE